MAKLHQILAIEKGIKTRVYAEFTELHQATQKPALLNGFNKTYQPRDEEGETYPPESQKVQHSAAEVLERVSGLLTSRPPRTSPTARRAPTSGTIPAPRKKQPRERASPLHDDAGAYRRLRGKVIDSIGRSMDFNAGDLVEMVADRAKRPFIEAGAELNKQIARLKSAHRTLRAALHVATRGRS